LGKKSVFACLDGRIGLSAFLSSQPLLLKHLLEAKVAQGRRVQVLHPPAQELELEREQGLVPEQPLGLAQLLQELALQRESLELSPQ
jgi:hypothetical protein